MPDSVPLARSSRYTFAVLILMAFVAFGTAAMNSASPPPETTER